MAYDSDQKAGYWSRSGTWWPIITNFTCRECKAKPGGHLTVDRACDTHSGIMTLISMNPASFLKVNSWGEIAGQKWAVDSFQKVEKQVNMEMDRYDREVYEPAILPHMKAIKKVENTRKRYRDALYSELPEVTILDKAKGRGKNLPNLKGA